MYIMLQWCFSPNLESTGIASHHLQNNMGESGKQLIERNSFDTIPAIVMTYWHRNCADVVSLKLAYDGGQLGDHDRKKGATPNC